MSSSPGKWVVCAKPNPAAQVRLICFPYAGGGARVFFDWHRRLPAEIEVVAVQPPGRDSRLAEPPFTRLEPLVEAAAEALRPELDLPLALFGHSMGALAAFEFARRLRRLGSVQPAHLFVSGCAGPRMPIWEKPIHALPDAEFLARLRELEGTPQQVLDNEELMEIFLPVLRADLAACETYVYREQEPLDCPISAYAGQADRQLSRERLDAWRAETRGPFVMRMFPGSHFYLNDSRAQLLQSLSDELLRGEPATWSHPPDDLVLHAGELHVWRAALDVPARFLSRLSESLSSEERERAGRFRRDVVRRRYVAAHGILRSILGRYLGTAPEQVGLRSRPGGKPELVPAAGVPPLSFNLSHSGSLALVAVARDTEVGVDVERLRPLRNIERLAERYFAPGEKAILRRLPPDQRQQAFFRCWTRKEAYIKARGEGLSLGLDRFEVSFAPGEPARLLGHQGQPDQVHRWWMADLDPGPGYVAACVAEGNPKTLVLWDCSGPFGASGRG